MWAFVFQKIGELPGDMTKAAILRLAGILLFTVFYYAVSQNACAYFRRTFLKRINIQLKRDVFDAVLDPGSGYDPVYEQQQWDVSLNTE